MSAKNFNNMSRYLISYDLNNGEDSESYDDVKEYIESFPNYAKALYSQWVVESEKSVADIRDELKDIVDGDDVVLVVKVISSWASTNLPKDAVAILKD